MSYPKPFLKWVGGKTKLLDALIPLFPKEINNYHEIFLGGGSVLLAVLYAFKIKKSIMIKEKIYAYDLNKELIYVYKNVQSNPSELLEILNRIINEYNQCPVLEKKGKIKINPQSLEEGRFSKEHYYYWCRLQYNSLQDKTSLLGSVYFIFLNKTCFRGVFRVGPRGFNVPYGNYENPEIVNREHINEIHNLIQGVEFIHSKFEASIQNIGENDFAYLDPPYLPININSFVGYTENGFSGEQHETLFKLCHEMKRNNKKFVMSNADVPLIRNSFEKEFKIESIDCRRAIHSKKPNSTAKEVIIL
jgi:DNA adenine methylase